MLSWLYSKIFSEPVLPERTIPTAPAPIPPSTPLRPPRRGTRGTIPSPWATLEAPDQDATPRAGTPRPAKTRPGRRSRMQILRYNADQRDRGSSKPLMNGLTQPR
jgi:hypothetical protein